MSPTAKKWIGGALLLASTATPLILALGFLKTLLAFAILAGIGGGVALMSSADPDEPEEGDDEPED